jgi:hypothetical protein
MKKLFALALLSSLATGAQAQTAIKAGTIQLGGNVGYFHSSLEAPVSTGSSFSVKQTTVTNQFAIAPSVGFFVADNLAVGISGAYQINQQKNTYSPVQGFPNYEATTKQFRIGAFAQYYKMLTEQFGFTGTLGGGYQYFGQPYNYGNNDIATKGAYANLTPSIVFFPIPKLAIGASIGGINYAYTSYKTPSFFNSSDTYASSSFGADFGLSQLLFSGTYYFGR